MATKFLRKIILEELKKVLKEEEKPQLGPQSGNFQSTNILAWASNDSSGKNKEKFMATDPNNEESVKSLMMSFYGSDFQNAYNNPKDISEFTKKFKDAKEFAGPKGQWITTGPSRTEPWQVPQKLDISPNVENEKFNVATSGKWGIKCKNALEIQASVRSKVEFSDTMTQDKKLILIGAEGKGRGRLGDGIMGASTLSVINYAMKKNNLGKGFAQFPLNLKGAKMACNDKYTVPQVITALQDIDPNILASFFMPKGQGTETSGTAVAKADTGTQISESKLLEKKILRELAKMLGK